MDWLFVVGIALDIAGGALLAGPTVLVGRKEIARRRVLFPSGGPTLDKARELALSRVGLGLLATGFSSSSAGTSCRPGTRGSSSSHLR